MEKSRKDIQAKKKALRKQMKIKKDEVSFEEKKKRSQVIWEQVEQLPIFQQAKYVMLYWSMNDEVFTHDFVKKYGQSKHIILPAIIGNELELRLFESEQLLTPDKQYKVMEPTGNVFETPELLDLIIVPGVAFDKNNNRLGRGKAFYDKLLRTVNCPKIGVCFDFQFVKEVPYEDTDIQMDNVIHETTDI